LWWENVASRVRQANEILTALHRQYRMPQLYTKIVGDLTDLSRFLQAKETAAANRARAATEAVERERESRAQEFERYLAVLSFVLLPLSIIFSGMALWADPDPVLFWTSLDLAFIAAVLIAMPSARAALRGRRS
jgi:hypothetical protein